MLLTHNNLIKYHYPIVINYNNRKYIIPVVHNDGNIFIHIFLLAKNFDCQSWKWKRLHRIKHKSHLIIDNWIHHSLIQDFGNWLSNGFGNYLQHNSVLFYKRLETSHILYLDNQFVCRTDEESGFINIDDIYRIMDKNKEKINKNIEKNSKKDYFGKSTTFVNPQYVLNILKSNNFYNEQLIQFIFHHKISVDTEKDMRYIEEKMNILSISSEKKSENVSISMLDCKDVSVNYILRFEVPKGMYKRGFNNRNNKKYFYKFGISSDIYARLAQHENDKEFKNVILLHLFKFPDHQSAKLGEKRLKRVTSSMGLSINYGKKKECFQADEKEVVVIANEMKNFVRECNNKYYSKDMFTNIRNMLRSGEITFDQFLQACKNLKY